MVAEGERAPAGLVAERPDIDRRDRAAPAAAASGAPTRRRRLSSLTLRILAINLFAVAILFVGVLYLDRYQNSLIEAELEALSRQGQVFARAVAELAADEVAGRRAGLAEEVVRRMLRRAGQALGTRARVFGPDGALLADTLIIGRPGGQVMIRPLPPPAPAGEVEHWAVRVYERVVNWLPRRGDMPVYRESALQRAGHYEEVVVALGGDVGRSVRVSESGSLVLSVAVPVQRYRQVLGALMLSIEGGEIDQAVRDVRFEILGVFALVFAITVLLSLYLASTITRPIQRLAAAAELVRRSHSRQHRIPDLGGRGDEIGDLSRALHDMTENLWQRMDAIERFAADVAHEIKNPLTSVRSAVETAIRVNDPAQQAKLLAIVLDDVQRLDRLISDISEASRLDAELSRAENAPVDVGAMVATLAEIHQTAHGEGPVRVICDVAPDTAGHPPLIVTGSEHRLVQVIRNLLSNAVSFSPENGTVTLSARLDGATVEVTVEDEGPGIPPGKLEAIFDRFYSERPEREKWGTHSGLGLSISKQIVEAHGGTIRASNRSGADGAVAGARFVVRLPLAAGAGGRG